MAEHFYTPTDLGYAVVFERHGATNVAVCSSVDGGERQGDAHAVHYRVRGIRVGPGVRLVRRAASAAPTSRWP